MIIDSSHQSDARTEGKQGGWGFPLSDCRDLVYLTMEVTIGEYSVLENSIK